MNQAPLPQPLTATEPYPFFASAAFFSVLILEIIADVFSSVTLSCIFPIDSTNDQTNSFYLLGSTYHISLSLERIFKNFLTINI